ncbi:hypothetical protein O2K51_01285 [Apibacter raozihei]|uniref:hypothetical protein n=1 Tax=Apibacter raozihei TaxID=2500547 RepID=UPI000FE3CE31|nr:hypothetical protein [Apibacter raozihei]
MKNFACMYLSMIFLSINSILYAQATKIKTDSDNNSSGLKNFKIQLSYSEGNSIQIDSTSITIKEQQPETRIEKSDTNYPFQQKDSISITKPVSITSDKPQNKMVQETTAENGTLNLDTSKTTNVDNNRDANRGKNIDNNRDKNRDRSRDLKRDKNRDRGREAKRDKNRDRDSSKNKGNNIFIKIKIKNKLN